MAASPEVVAEPTAAELADDVAGRVVTTLLHAQRDQRRASLVLTGGGILEQVFRSLAALPARDAVDWSRVDVFWGDERFVAADSDERNDKPAFALLLDHLPLEPSRIFRMPPADSPGDSADAAADSYAATLARVAQQGQGGRVPHFDVVLLGVGPDGHCCSLFPEHPGVYEDEAYVIGVHNAPKPPPTRLSLTFRALAEAEEIWFVVAGTGKAEAVAMALGGTGRVQVPAAGPRGRQRTLWLLDRAAAAKLPKSLVILPTA